MAVGIAAGPNATTSREASPRHCALVAPPCQPTGHHKSLAAANYLGNLKLAQPVECFSIGAKIIRALINRAIFHRHSRVESLTALAWVAQPLRRVKKILSSSNNKRLKPLRTQTFLWNYTSISFNLHTAVENRFQGNCLFNGRHLSHAAVDTAPMRLSGWDRFHVQSSVATAPMQLSGWDRFHVHSAVAPLPCNSAVETASMFIQRLPPLPCNSAVGTASMFIQRLPPLPCMQLSGWDRSHVQWAVIFFLTPLPCNLAVETASL